MTEIPASRRNTMRAVKDRDTGPELTVRRTAHAMGYRYRLRRKDLPGRPDLVFVSRRKVIFVHGCFWHQHDCSRGARIPKSRQDYWVPKLRRNVERDSRNIEKLRELGWDALTIWECEIRDISGLQRILLDFLK